MAVAPVVPSSRLRMTSVTSRVPGAVKTSGRVTLEVRGHDLVARVPNGRRHLLALIDESRDLPRLDLDPGDLAMVPHAHLPESHRFQRILSCLDLPQHGHSDRRAVRYTRRQARKRWLVPVGQTERARNGADLGFRHARLEERESNPAAHGRPVARSVIAGVVGSRAVGEVRETELVLHRSERVEQLLLAVEAAVGTRPSGGPQLDLAGRELDE